MEGRESLYPPAVPTPTVTWNQNGWKCQNCGSGVAPFMPYCPHCAPKKDTAKAATSE